MSTVDDYEVIDVSHEAADKMLDAIENPRPLSPKLVEALEKREELLNGSVYLHTKNVQRG